MTELMSYCGGQCSDSVGRVIMRGTNVEFIWKEGVVAQSEGRCGTELQVGKSKQGTSSLSQDSRSPGRDLNPGPPQYQAVLIYAGLRHSVPFVL
jgi:hypothetical protein